MSDRAIKHLEGIITTIKSGKYTIQNISEYNTHSVPTKAILDEPEEINISIELKKVNYEQ